MGRRHEADLNSPPPFLRYVLKNPWLWQVRSWLIYVAAFGLIFFAFDRPRESRLLWVGEVFLILLCLSVCVLDRLGRRWLSVQEAVEHRESMKDWIGRSTAMAAGRVKDQGGQAPIVK